MSTGGLIAPRAPTCQPGAAKVLSLCRVALTPRILITRAPTPLPGIIADPIPPRPQPDFVDKAPPPSGPTTFITPRPDNDPTLGILRAKIDRDGPAPADPSARPDAGAEPSTAGGIEHPSSRELGRNLEDAGFVRQAGDHAHHIVPGADPRAAEARRILEREGIGINEADNGVFLPGGTHLATHSKGYYESLTAALQRAEPGAVRDVLNRIHDQILGGRFS